MKRIKNQFIPELLKEVTNFQGQKPPNAASLAGVAEEHDVTELTSRIKEVAWENLGSAINTAIEIINSKFPALGNESSLSQLSSMFTK